MIDYLKSNRLVFDLVMAMAMISVVQLSESMTGTEGYFKLAILMIFIPMLALEWRKWRRKI
jgi:hypothetical protein